MLVKGVRREHTNQKGAYSMRSWEWPQPLKGYNVMLGKGNHKFNLRCKQRF